MTIAALRPTASETYTAADTGVFVVRAAGAHSTQLLVSLTLGGTAGNYGDYFLENVVSVPKGADSAIIRVVPFSDGVAEGDESLVLTVVPPPVDNRVGYETLYTVGAQNTATVTFKDAISETRPFVVGTLFRGRLARREQVDTFVVDLTSSQTGHLTMSYNQSGPNTRPPSVQTVHPPGPRTLWPQGLSGNTFDQGIGGSRDGTYRILVSDPNLQGGDYTYYQMLITRTP